MTTPEDTSKSNNFPSLREWKAGMDEAWDRYGNQVHASSTSIFGGLFFHQKGDPTIGDIPVYYLEKGIYTATNAVVAGFEHGVKRFKVLRGQVHQAIASRLRK